VESVPQVPVRSVDDAHQSSSLADSLPLPASALQQRGFIARQDNHPGATVHTYLSI